MPNMDFIKEEEDDDFSADSWESASNEEIDVVEMAYSLMSPDASPEFGLSSPVKTEEMDFSQKLKMSLKNSSIDLVSEYFAEYIIS